MPTLLIVSYSSSSLFCFMYAYSVRTVAVFISKYFMHKMQITTRVFNQKYFINSICTLDDVPKQISAQKNSQNFHFSNRNVNPIILRNKDWKNSLFIIQGTLIFSHSWLSSCGKVKIPHSRLRRSWGIFILPQLLSHEWENINVP